jgi:hypothetical protein
MLDISVAYNRYKFLGNEFLTWLWFMMDEDKKGLLDPHPDLADLCIGNRVVLRNTAHNRDEVITIRGDGAGLEEGQTALKKGAVVTELNLKAKIGENEWRFHIKGESLNLSSVKTPETGRIETAEDVEGAVLEKIYLYDQAIKLLNDLYQQFIRLRVSPDWEKGPLRRMAKWIRQGGAES